MGFRILAVLMLLPTVAFGQGVTKCDAFGEGNVPCVEVENFEVVEEVVFEKELVKKEPAVKRPILGQSCATNPNQKGCGPIFKRNEGCVRCREEIIEKPYYVKNYVPLVDLDYKDVHRGCQSFLPVNFSYVDFRLKKESKFADYMNKLGDYRFRIFGCRRNDKEMFLNVGRTMQKDMDFFDIFNEVYGQCIPQQNLPKDLCDENATSPMPEYVLTAEIVDYAMNVCDEFDWKTVKNTERRSGTSEMTVVWRLMDVARQNVYWKGSSTGYASLDKGTINGEVELVEEAFRDALSQLRYLEGFEKQIATKLPAEQQQASRKMLAELEKAMNPAKCEYKESIFTKKEEVIVDLETAVCPACEPCSCALIGGEVVAVDEGQTNVCGVVTHVNDDGTKIIKPITDVEKPKVCGIVTKVNADGTQTIVNIEDDAPQFCGVVKKINNDGTIIVAKVEAEDVPKICGYVKQDNIDGSKTIVAIDEGSPRVCGVAQKFNDTGTIIVAEVLEEEKPMVCGVVRSTNSEGVSVLETIGYDGEPQFCGVVERINNDGTVVVAEALSVDELGVCGVAQAVNSDGTIIIAEVVEDDFSTCNSEDGCGPIFERNKGRCGEDGSGCGPIFKRNEGCESLACRWFGDDEEFVIDEASGIDSFGNVDTVRYIESDWVGVETSDEIVVAVGDFCIENQLVNRDMDPYNTYKTRASIVEITSLSGKKEGVGLIINDQFILTSAALIGKDDNNFNVKTINGVEFGATGFRFSPSKNVALLLADKKIDYTPLPLQLELPPVGATGFMTLGMASQEEGAVEGYVDGDTSIAGYRYSKDKGAEIITNQHTQSLTVGGALVDDKGNIYGIAHYGKRYNDEPDMYMPIEIALKSMSVELCGRDFLNQEPWQKSSVETAKSKAPEEIKEGEKK